MWPRATETEIGAALCANGAGRTLPCDFIESNVNKATFLRHWYLIHESLKVGLNSEKIYPVTFTITEQGTSSPFALLYFVFLAHKLSWTKRYRESSIKPPH